MIKVCYYITRQKHVKRCKDMIEAERVILKLRNRKGKTKPYLIEIELLNGEVIKRGV